MSLIILLKSFRMLESSLASQFPEFTLSDFKSSCLNDSQSQNTADAKNIFKKEEFTLPSSVSMPAIAPLQPSSSNHLTEEKRLELL